MRAAFYKVVRPGVQGIYSRLVRWVDRGPYSHCELIFSDGMAGSASWMDGGVRLKRIDFDPAKWDFIEIPDHLEPAARAWFEQHKGEGYDLLGNLRFVFWMVRESAKDWFCNEAQLAALGFREAWRHGPNGTAALLLSIYPQPAQAGFFTPDESEHQ
ncbi:hypothetical protein [Acidovorax sp. Root217]|uniref:hypothetical protein n=1 Tax=Acidovorax sp. Root217 TaxID=1736492 RepID=UPI00070C0DD3|nr:hypothetical protein [Acidovorax sp. Root217]KRC30693.1 hypothetical protein ASE31_00475 [Acidovorax sp. Root217]